MRKPLIPWPDYITWEIPILKIDPDEGPDQIMNTVDGRIFVNTKQTMNWQEAHIQTEEIAAGETYYWAFSESEVQLILRGKAKMTYSLGSTSHTDQQTIKIEQGDAFIIPRGARVSITADKSGPLRRFCVIMPFFQRAWGYRNPEKMENLKSRA